MVYQNYPRVYGSNELTQIFTGGVGDPSSTLWYTWTKPKGVKFIYFMAVGGACGGSSGYLQSATNAVGGYGGGGGAIVCMYSLSQFIPDTLYISPGYGGLGGAATSSVGVNNGGYGGDSLVCLTQASGSQLLRVGGGNGSFQWGGGSFSNGSFNPLGQVTYSNGLNGAAAVTNASGTSITSTYILAGGAGGGAAAAALAYNGGRIATVDPFPTLNGGTSGVNGTNGTKGACGHLCGSILYNALDVMLTNLPRYPLPGAGGGGYSGGSSFVGRGGDGGDGGFGCGGGGGGAAYGPTGTFSGKGGNGGPGFVIISCGY